ncbi:carboxylesterase 5A-like [Watersipora subatra]|uniref:carboxylesterase 5A-like n=1 Tax=Watersipora subatra TaxID=2589382 RepID=UPI00355B4376
MRATYFLCFILVMAGWSSLTTVEAQQLFTQSTSLGRITGIQNSINGDEYVKFLGIPYGTGDRLTKPVAYGNFIENPLLATSYGSPCPQFLNGEIVGSEDCLKLDVFTPKCRRRCVPKSVMIWIHGGSFKYGSSDVYPLDVLAAANDVVAVSFNYRLGAFGFLASPEDGLLGNYGLWDQQLAIQWVKNNIADYGGDPNSITLFGESAGANAITFHMVSPLTPPNLFHRGIMQSGSAFSIRIQDIPFRPNFEFVSATFGCNATSDELACIRAIPMSSFLTISEQLQFYPSTDGELIVTSFEENLVRFTRNNHLQHDSTGLGNFANYDILTGWNTLEGLFFTPVLEQVNLAITGQDISGGVSDLVIAETINAATRGSYAESRDLITRLYIQHYMNDPNPLVSDGRSIDDRRVEAFVNIFSDLVFKVPSITHLQIHSKISSRRTYAYEFAYNPPGSGPYGPREPEWLNVAADHGDEIPFVIGSVLAPENICQLTGVERCGQYNRRERWLSRYIMNLWTSFAKSGQLDRRHKQFEFRGDQSYIILDINGTRSDTYPRSAEHRFAADLDEVALQARGI